MRDVGPTDRGLTPGVPATPGAARGAATAASPTPPQPSVPSPAVQLAPSLARWLRGGVVEAVVVGHNAAGLPLAQTATANFALAGGPPLELNARLLMQLFASGTELKAAIIEIDGRKLQPPPEVALTPAPPAARQVPPGPPSPQPALTQPAPPQPTNPALLQASAPERAPLLARLNPFGAAPPSAKPPLAGEAAAKPLVIGGTLSATVVAPPPGAPVKPAIHGAYGAPNPPARGVPPPGAPGVPNTPASAPPPAGRFSPARPAAFPVGAVLVLTPRSIDPPPDELPAPGATLAPVARPLASQPSAASTGKGAAPVILHGVVAPPTPQVNGRQTLVHTTQGTLRLETNAPLAAGTRLSVEILAVQLPPAPELPGEAPIARSLSRLARDWRALGESLQAVAAADPAVANRVQEHVLPKPGPRLASAWLLFLGALQSGDSNAWLGADFAAALDNAGRKELPQRLAEEFRQIAEAQRQENGDWRLYVLPLLGPHEIHPLHLFVRRRRRPSSGAKDDDVRFVLDLELQTVGALQFDGLVRPGHFDLILRSRDALPRHWRADIAALFDDALAASGLKGQVAFQAGAPPPPLEQAPKTTARAGVTV
jgi:hypothetical protein